MFRILLAENEELFVSGFGEVMSNLKETSICAIVQNVDNLAEVCQRVKPDLVLTRTFYYLQKTAFDAVEELKAACPEVKVIMMLDNTKQAYLERALNAGVDACIERGASPINYILTINKILNGNPVSNPEFEGNSWGPNKVRLTKRDKDVVMGLCQNWDNKVIADVLGLKEEQIELSINRILEKTKHRNVLGLIFEAIHKGYDYNWRAEA